MVVLRSSDITNMNLSVRQLTQTCKTQRNIAKSVYISKCTNIFTNLAMEDWLYAKRDFTNHHLLMLWRNEPCVVIGRHQNPWMECNFPALPNLGAPLARRNSGGGTVYHDLENLNLTFFTSRQDYCRKKNLELMAQALKKSYNIDSYINKREDLCIGDSKISGTASKLGRTNAYHHCTLLVNSKKNNITLALKNVLGDKVKTNASTSVRSKIMNLSEVCPQVTVDGVMGAIIQEFLQLLDTEEDKKVTTIDDTLFPGVSEIKNTFLSSQWRFERTPKFTICRDLFGGALSAFLVVDKGRVSDCGLENNDMTMSVEKNNLETFDDLFYNLIGKSFSKEVLDEFDMIVCGLKNSDKCKNLIGSR